MTPDEIGELLTRNGWEWFLMADNAARLYGNAVTARAVRLDNRDVEFRVYGSSIAECMSRLLEKTGIKHEH